MVTQGKGGCGHLQEGEVWSLKGREFTSLTCSLQVVKQSRRQMMQQTRAG